MTKTYESVPNTNINTRSRIHSLCAVALMTAVTCVLAPFSIPVGPIPISLTTLVIYISVYLLGWKMASLSCFVYILIGMAGLPVFSGFSGGPGKLAGPTGGYIIGFIPMAVITGMMLSHAKSRIIQFLAMLLGTAVCYVFGTAWFCVITDSGVAAAMSACVLPFIPGDIIKMAVSFIICPEIKKSLKSAF